MTLTKPTQQNQKILLASILVLVLQSEEINNCDFSIFSDCRIGVVFIVKMTASEMVVWWQGWVSAAHHIIS